MTALYVARPRDGDRVPYPGVDPISAERPKLLAGGHGLASTAADYHRFTQMLLRRGELDGVRLLAPRTVDLMTANHLPRQRDPDRVRAPAARPRRQRGLRLRARALAARRPDRGQDAVGGRRVPLGGRRGDRVLGRPGRGHDRALLHPGALRLRRRLGGDAPRWSTRRSSEPDGPARRSRRGRGSARPRRPALPTATHVRAPPTLMRCPPASAISLIDRPRCASTLTGLETASQTARISSAVRSPGA